MLKQPDTSHLTTREARKRLCQLIAQGKRITILKRNRPVALLLPLDPRKPKQ